MDRQQLLTCLQEITTNACKAIQRWTASRAEDGDHPLNLSVNPSGKKLPEIYVDSSDKFAVSTENFNAKSLHSDTIHSYATDSDSTDSECEEIVNISKLRVPLVEGWKRETIIYSFTEHLQGSVGYYAPCSDIKLEDIVQIQTILKQQSSSLTTENFSFSIRPIVGTFIQKSSESDTTIRILTEADMIQRFEDREYFKSYIKKVVNENQQLILQELHVSRNTKETTENDLSIRMEQRPSTSASPPAIHNLHSELNQSARSSINEPTMNQCSSVIPSSNGHNSLPSYLVSQNASITTMNTLDQNQEPLNSQHMNAEMNLATGDNCMSLEEFLETDIFSDLSSLFDTVLPAETERVESTLSMASPKHSYVISDGHKETTLSGYYASFTAESDDIPHKKARFEIEYESEVNIRQAVTSAILEVHLATKDLVNISDSEDEVLVDVSKLQSPLGNGWRRETIMRSLTKNADIRGDVSYYAPDSQMALKNIEQIQKILDSGSSDLTLNNFSFSSHHIVGLFLQPFRNGTEFIRITDVELTECLDLLVKQRNVVKDPLRSVEETETEEDVAGKEEDGHKEENFNKEEKGDFLVGNETQNIRHEGKLSVASVPVKPLTRHTSRTNVIGKSFKYICDICNKSLSKGNLSRHKKIHTGAKKYKCVTCKKSFGRKDALSQHLIALKHGSYRVKRKGVKILYPCKNCGKHYAYKASFENHLRQCREG